MDQPDLFDSGGVIRQLRPSELPRFRDHLPRLDLHSRDRFNGAIGLVACAERSFRDGATVIGYVERDRVLGAAGPNERADFEEPPGEIAFSVERALQHRGIGSALLERLLGNARGLGYTRLRVTTHPQNAATRVLARRFGAHLHFEAGDTVGEISLPPAAPFAGRFANRTVPGEVG
jgi:GNAT superfamily N-acetyltransferase